MSFTFFLLGMLTGTGITLINLAQEPLIKVVGVFMFASAAGVTLFMPKRNAND